MQYNWNDGSNFYFMNLSTFEEFSLPKEECPDWEFFSEGQEVTMRKFKDEVISVSLPKVCEFTVLTIDETRTRYVLMSILQEAINIVNRLHFLCAF